MAEQRCRYRALLALSVLFWAGSLCCAAENPADRDGDALVGNEDRFPLVTRMPELRWTLCRPCALEPAQNRFCKAVCGRAATRAFWQLAATPDPIFGLVTGTKGAPVVSTPVPPPSPLAGSSEQQAMSGDSGIAAKYPLDAGIASDPDVLYADDFESYTAATKEQLTAPDHWTGVNWPNNLRLATDPAHQPPNTGSTKCMEMSLPISSKEVGTGITKEILPAQDLVYARMYQKFAPDFSCSGHNGVRISARYPGSGTAPSEDGTGYFLFLLQNGMVTRDATPPGPSHLYVYWPRQRYRIIGAPVGRQWGDHWMPTGEANPRIDAAHLVGEDGQAVANRGEWVAFPSQYPDWKPMADFTPLTDRWYCVELMVRANTPGQSDGEVKYWIDGELKGSYSHLFMRSVADLKLDTVHFMLHSMRTTHVQRKWYDNVVIAKKYIGPVRPR